MVVFVNSTSIVLPDHACVADALAAGGIVSEKGMALAVNTDVIPVSMWHNHQLSEGDKIILIRATQGG